MNALGPKMKVEITLRAESQVLAWVTLTFELELTNGFWIAHCNLHLDYNISDFWMLTSNY